MSTAIGLPVSTSHCLVGALIGVGVAGKYSGAQAAEGETPRNAPLDLTVLKKIVLAWYALLPVLCVSDQFSDSTQQTAGGSPFL